MNKNELIQNVADRSGSTKGQVKSVVEAMLEVIEETAALGDKVALPGFGTFGSRDAAQRIARSPRTGEEVVVPATRKPTFKAGSHFKAVVAGELPIKNGTSS